MFSLQVCSCFCGLPYGRTVLLRLLDDEVQEPSSSNCNILLSESFRIISPNRLNSADHLRNTSWLCGHHTYFTSLFVLSVCNKSSYLVMHLFSHFTVQYLHLCFFYESAISYFLLQLFLTIEH